MKIAWLHFDLCGGPQIANTEKILQGMRQAAAEAPPATPPTTKIRLLKINLLFKSGQRWLPSLTFR